MTTRRDLFLNAGGVLAAGGSAALSGRGGEPAGPINAHIVRWAGRLVLIAALLVSGCTAADPTATAPPQSPAAGHAAGCTSPTRTDPLPTWARAGFSGDGDGIAYVVARRGDILGVLFGRPLSSPPAPDRSNKILWVSRVPVTPGGSLEITATLDGTTGTVRRTVAGGPGPSGVDMPKPGCWHFTLAWSGHTDAMDLIYEPGT
jgi:hypothetical protein